MSLFSRNPNEASYVGGKKHWADVIKNSGSGELLIWRQPEEDFNTNSTLIVMPGEQAIFIKGGNIEQVFDAGTYSLSTENYPFISRLRNAFTGGISTFNCVVYFVRSAHSIEIKWGTDSPIQVRDKILGIATKLRCRGAYKVQISNPALFLSKLIGNNISFQFQEELSKYFISEFQSKIKSVIARALNESDLELLGIDARLDELSDTIEPYMNAIVEMYGLRCVRFSISGLDIEDDELRKRYDEIGMDAISKLRNAQADLGVMNILGDNWGKQQAANILGDLARNPGAGGVAATGAGLGMGIAASSVFSGMAQQMFSPMKHEENIPVQQQTPANAGPNLRFTQSSTTSNTPAQNTEDPLSSLKTLQQLLEAGLITQFEYDEKKKEILNRL